jgi:hypothetical protein
LGVITISVKYNNPFSDFEVSNQWTKPQCRKLDWEEE